MLIYELLLLIYNNLCNMCACVNLMHATGDQPSTTTRQKRDAGANSDFTFYDLTPLLAGHHCLSAPHKTFTNTNKIHLCHFMVMVWLGSTFTYLLTSPPSSSSFPPTSFSSLPSSLSLSHTEVYPSSTPQIKAYFIHRGIYSDPINCRASPVLLLLHRVCLYVSVCMRVSV